MHSLLSCSLFMNVVFTYTPHTTACRQQQARTLREGVADSNSIILDRQSPRRWQTSSDTTTPHHDKTQRCDRQTPGKPTQQRPDALNPHQHTTRQHTTHQHQHQHKAPMNIDTHIDTTKDVRVVLVVMCWHAIVIHERLDYGTSFCSNVVVSHALRSRELSNTFIKTLTKLFVWIDGLTDDDVGCG